MKDIMKFKILMYGHIMVDMNLLDKGIYETSKPTLHEYGQTIDNLIKWAEIMVDMTGKCFFSDEYFENLRQCKLVSFTLNKIEDDNQIS